jgi:tRNA(Ile)-lysidine synthase
LNPQDRILATCDENYLPFVTDPTNFQPHITLRNAVRQMLEQTASSVYFNVCFAANASMKFISKFIFQERRLPINIQEDLKRIQNESDKFSLDLSAGREQLRVSVKDLGTRLDDIDSKG